MDSRGSKVINGFALRTVYIILNIALAFFMMPFILHSLGDKMYGLWVLFSLFLIYISYLDVGLSSAVGRFISRAVGQEDSNGMNEIVNTAFIIYLFIGIFTLLLTICLVALAGLFVKYAEELLIVRSLVFILGLNMAIGFPARAFGAVIGANLHYEISEVIALAELLLRNLLIFILFSMGYRIIALGIIVLITSLVSYVAYIFFAFKVRRDLRFSYEFFKKSRVKELFSYSVYTFIYKLAETLISRIDAFVVTVFIGLSAVAHYSIALTFISYFSNFIFNVMALIGPVFSQDEGNGNYEGIRHKLLFITKLSIYITMFIGLMLVFYGKAFIIRWLGVEYVDAYPVLVVLAISTVIAMMQAPSGSLLFSISRHRFLAYIGIIEGISNLGLSILFVKKYGLVGVALGTAVPMVLIRLFIQPLYVCKVLQISRYKYYVETLAYCIAVSAAGVIPLYLIARYFIYPSYGRLMLLSGWQFLIYGIVISIIGFNADEKTYLFNIVKSKLMLFRLAIMPARERV